MRAFLAAVSYLFALEGVSASTPPLEAYGQLPDVRAAVLSPEGRKAALLVSQGERTAIVVQDLSTGTREIVADVSSIKARNAEARAAEEAARRDVAACVVEVSKPSGGNPSRDRLSQFPLGLSFIKGPSLICARFPPARIAA